MGKFGNRIRFPLKALAAPAEEQELGPDQLDDDLPVQTHLASPVHDAHAAIPDDLEQFEIPKPNAVSGDG